MTLIIVSIIYAAILLHFVLTDVPRKAGLSGRRWIMFSWIAGFCFAIMIKIIFDIPPS